MKKLWFVAAGTAVALLQLSSIAVGGSAQAASAQPATPVPALAPANLTGPSVYKDENGKTLFVEDASTTAGALAASSKCTPVSGRDNPHVTGGDASGHGWWGKGNCKNDYADVYNCLYEYYTDVYWYKKACSPTKKLKPYGGSTWRTNARKKCNSESKLISWRNHVDVNVIDEPDTAEKPMNQAAIKCVAN